MSCCAMDGFLVNEVEVSSRIPTPLLITRCDKEYPDGSPNLHFKPIEKTPTQDIILLDHHPLSLHWVDSSFNLVYNCSTMCLFSFTELA
ncbi:hypothetical protein TNCV_3563371 [Trichonephila clavipes]|nr:hypothetical protein TNCV_3563371 [Trichonephila clavipes]